MNQTANSFPPTVAAAAASQPATPARQLDEVVRRVKMELVSGCATRQDRSAGSNPYEQGGSRDIWGKRRRA